jgi:toxoflavin synthase
MAHFSKTQYDSLYNKYGGINDLPIDRAIIPNVERLVKPYIKDAKILELACGTGRFTKLLLDWGASWITGVDISQGMIDTAKADMLSNPKYKDKVTFLLSDASVPFSAPLPGESNSEGKFDLVFAAWLLNYAPDLPTMTAMFKNISKHLQPGGIFITVLPNPEDDPKICIDNVCAHDKLGYGYHIEVIDTLSITLPNEQVRGYHVNVKFRTNPPVEFGNYYLSKKVHERAAPIGGMKGELRWEKAILPEDEEVLQGYMKERLPRGYLDKWAEYPDFGMLVVKKD